MGYGIPAALGTDAMPENLVVAVTGWKFSNGHAGVRNDR